MQLINLIVAALLSGLTGVSERVEDLLLSVFVRAREKEKDCG